MKFVKIFLDNKRINLISMNRYVYLALSQNQRCITHNSFGIKILTSYFLFTKDKKPDWALSLHRQPVLDVLILILFTFHSVYGLRTIVMDFGCQMRKRLFWLSNTVASIISIVLIYLYFVMS